MSLYAIGDLHLHFGVKIKSQIQLYDPLWKDHEEKFMNYCKEVISDEDTLVLVGDHSWGKNLEECEKDFDYIRSLPGRKILTRGNHDMFWDAKKTKKLNERFQPELNFLQDAYEVYGDYALIATKGYAFEGPYYLNCKGEIIGWDEEKEEHAKKLVEREAQRLYKSFEAAKADGYEKFILFLHYPPTNIMESDSVFTQIAETYDVKQVIYAHCHGQRRFHDSIEGKYNGRTYHLVSGDYLKWIPMKILD
ncbi:MAG: metallophosphoesterase [Erysipelotrichaceae bacterium]|jgi:predicted phosphohydrolase|nr:metallophosphoesterase [Erysipelotrichaceae bacterium]